MATIKTNFLSGMEVLQAASDRMIELNENTTYLFFQDGSNPATSAAKWAVCKIVRSGSTYPFTWTTEWSNGSFNKDQIADNYASLTYKYKNF